MTTLIGSFHVTFQYNMWLAANFWLQKEADSNIRDPINGSSFKKYNYKYSDQNWKHIINW